MTDRSKHRMATTLVHGGARRSQYGETSEGLFLNSGYTYASAEEAAGRFDGSNPGFAYGRYAHPNLAMLQDRLAQMEGAEACLVMASGMAAVTAALLSQLKTGDHVVAGAVLFSSCHYVITQLLPRFGISVTLVDGEDLDGWERALAKPNTVCAFIETPGNPTLALTDIAEVAKRCKAHGVRLMVDNVFATPLLQHPLELGADVVIYSTTKHIDGQGRCFGGAVLGDAAFINDTVLPFHRHTGPHMSHFNAWLTMKGLETLPLRVAQSSASAQAMAEMLEAAPQVSVVHYPGLESFPQRAIAKKQMTSGGPMLAFELKGGRTAAFAFMNALKLILLSNNLGDARSLIAHPASTTHYSLGEDVRAAMGIGDGLLRFSVGLEDVADLQADVAQALTQK